VKECHYSQESIRLLDLQSDHLKHRWTVWRSAP